MALTAIHRLVILLIGILVGQSKNSSQVVIAVVRMGRCIRNRGKVGGTSCASFGASLSTGRQSSLHFEHHAMANTQNLQRTVRRSDFTCNETAQSHSLQELTLCFARCLSITLFGCSQQSSTTSTCTASSPLTRDRYCNQSIFCVATNAYSARAR